MAAPWESDPVVGQARPAAAAPWAFDPVVGESKPAGGRARIDAYLAETDSVLGLPAGTSARQIKQESGFRPDAVSPVGAVGLAQMMPATTAALSKRLGRQLDPRNPDDALAMHREVMRENLAKFGTPDKALRAYNAGWNTAKWDNPETNNYVRVIAGDPQAAAAERLKAGQRGSVRDLGNVFAGAVRGAGSIGATILAPFDAAARAMGVQNDFIGRTDRREAMTAALGDLGADTDSTAFAGGKLGAEVAGTLGVGGALAAPARVLGTSPAVVNALASSGFNTGAAGGNLMLRMGAGGTVGAAGAGMVDPSSAALGGAVGAALPPAVRGLAAGGRAVGAAFRPAVAGANDLVRGLNVPPNELAAIVDKLRAAETLVPGAPPTVAQALLTPEASIMQRVVHDSPGAARLRDKIVQQAQARTAALEGVAPTNAGGLSQAREDLSQSVERYVVPEQQRLKAQVGQMFEAVDPFARARIGLPLDDMQGAVDTFLGPGTFGQGGKAREALQAARAIGTQELPAIKAIRPTAGDGDTLLSAVKRNGGINLTSRSSQRFAGEVGDLKQGGLGRVVVKTGGKSLDEMTERMYEAGFIPEEDPALLIDLLKNKGKNTYATGRESMEALYQRQAEAHAGDLPGAEIIPREVPWRELQNLRTSIGDAWEAAKAKGLTKEAGALNAMRRSLDDTTMAAATGRGKPEDFMPPDVVARWLEANKSFAALQERFHTGPQASIFRKGGDGQPARQGGEIAAAFWGNRPGLASDVESFKRMVGDSPALLGQFKSLITTDAAKGADAAGNLTTKFSKWVDQTLPGLRGAFSPEEVQTLQRIAADIDRAAVAQKLGTSQGGSNTYQNAANALHLGLLDAPGLSSAASRIPGVRMVAAPALDMLRGSLRNAKATRLSGLLADSGEAANALQALLQRPVSAPADNELLRLLGLSAARGASLAGRDASR